MMILKPGDIVHITARVIEDYPGDVQVQIDGERARHRMCVDKAAIVQHIPADDVTIETVTGPGERKIKVVVPKAA